MSSTELQKFVDAVVQNHEVATGLKRQTDHQGIVAYAQERGFDFDISDFEVLFKRELSELSPELQSKVLSASSQHWSWAFRQISAWRAMLMDGAGDGQS